MIALVDGDIVAFRCAAACENEGLEIALIRTYDMMQNILDETGADSYKCFLSGENNFRYIVNPEYKQHRKDKVDPIYRQACKDFLVSDWNAVVVDGYEADDALAMEQTASTIICSIDKDLLQIPGKHYNFVKKEFSEVSEIEGLRNFYKQMLIGDSADNIFGVKGIGKVKAANLIDCLETEQDMIDLTLTKYADEDETNFFVRYYMNADCLWLMRKEGETYSKRDYTVD